MKQMKPFYEGLFFILFLLSLAGAVGAQERQVTPDREGITANAPSVPVTGSGKLGTAKFLSDTSLLSNGSTAWASAFVTTVTLHNVTQCVKLSYSGEALDSTTAPPAYPVQLRALIDGIVLNGGFKVVDLADPDTPSAVAFNWWQCGLAPGAHIVKIQFRRDPDPLFAGDVAKVWHRTLIVEYNQ